MTDKTAEKQFQNDILQALLSTGIWKEGDSKKYNRELALYPEDLLGFIQDTQKEQWDKLKKQYPDPEKALLDRVAYYLNKVGELPSNDEMRKYGTLGVLRHPVKDRGARFTLCQFMPDHGLNPETLANYKKNRFRVVPELTYSPHIKKGTDESAKKWRIDFVFFVNGIPVVTMELKSEFKQNVEEAIKQYKKTRLPKDPITKKEEPLLRFKRGALVHFALSQYEAYMATKLDGTNTVFLPFNMGTKDGGAGNDPVKEGYCTSYVWETILNPDNLLRILERYIHLEIKDKEDYTGRKYKKENIIFPRYHQWDVVSLLLKTVYEEGPGYSYLIQHSAGSGKSNSIAWLSHQLATLHHKNGDKYFQSVIVITDRTLLDSQLQDTIYQFEHSSGMIARISDKSKGSKSEQLQEALMKSQAIIIVTIQTFPFVLEEIRKNTTLAGKSFAVIADEAHSSQTGRTATKVKEVLLAEEMDEEEDFTAEDMLNLTIRAKEGKGSISYFAFTATPKDRTIQLFGRKPDKDAPASRENMPAPFHVYTMKQAIEEGFILDILSNYVNYKEAYQLTLKDKETFDEEVDKRKGTKKVSYWVRIHPTSISQKIKIIIEHFRENVMSNLSGQAKAMVVTGSRLEAVKYKLAFDEYIKEKNYKKIQALIAFSGEVKHEDLPVNPKAYTENNMNPDLKGMDIRNAFDTEEYNVLLVANKFQTGFDQPKLCAMYVDKKVAGIECVQTFSRLNRTYPGKTKSEVYILDFVNEPEEIIKSFQPYYKTVNLTNLSDSNDVYDLMNKLNSAGVYDWEEVENFIKAYFDKTKGQEKLANICKPIVDRWRDKYNTFIQEIRKTNAEIKKYQKVKDKIGETNYKQDLKELELGKGELDLFKRNLGVFTRYYEFISQVYSMGDMELEKLSLFARHLQQLLKTEGIDEEIDLSGLDMQNYRLSQIKKQELKLENKEGEIDPTGTGEGGAKAKELSWLSEIIEQINEAFGGEFDGKETLYHTYAIVEKVKENELVMEQIKYNPIDSVMHGDLPVVVDDAVIEFDKMGEKKKDMYLGNEETRIKFVKLIYRIIKKQFDSGESSNFNIDDLLKGLKTT